jgi:homoaconitase/3-isopropylmalate dehydratase large subunit
MHWRGPHTRGSRRAVRDGYGVGTSEVEHVLATQTLYQKKSKNMRAVVDGKLPDGVTAKDIILAIIGEIGTAGATGYALEYAGDAVTALSMEGRMTVCNMSVEAGAKAGFIAPDDKVYAYLKDRPKAPKGEAWDAARRHWDTLRSDDGARFDREIRLDAARLPPLVTWGTSPEQVVSVTGRVPVPGDIADENKRIAATASLAYIGPDGRREDHRHRDRPRVHRLLHQWTDRGSAGGRRRGRRQNRQQPGQCHGCSGFRTGQGAGRSRRARPHLPRGRINLWQVLARGNFFGTADQSR